MTPEELDEARAKEAYAEWCQDGCPGTMTSDDVEIATRAARLAREGWKPPEPVDPDILAFRKWRVWTGQDPDNYPPLVGHAYLAGARMAREQERERAKVLVEYVEHHADHGDVGACNVFTKYEDSLW